MTRNRILVTGSSRGIGRAIALALAADGYTVTVHYRSRVTEAQAVVDLVRASGGEADMLCFDVRDAADCRAKIAEAIESGGAYWGVVVNAGVARDNTFAAIPPEEWHEVLDTTLGGFYNLLQATLMPMVRLRAGGRIVLVSSVAGLAGNRGQTNYSAAKAGLIGAGKALAVELAPRGITVNSVAPGLIDTEMAQTAPLDHILPSIPMGRMGKPEEVAATVAFLMSPGASYITRQVISINGGLT